jgi:hypothetical protein
VPATCPIGCAAAAIRGRSRIGCEIVPQVSESACPSPARLPKLLVLRSPGLPSNHLIGSSQIGDERLAISQRSSCPSNALSQRSRKLDQGPTPVEPRTWSLEISCAISRSRAPLTLLSATRAAKAHAHRSAHPGSRPGVGVTEIYAMTSLPLPSCEGVGVGMWAIRSRSWWRLATPSLG